MKEEIRRAISNKTLLPKSACYFLGKIGLSNQMLQALQIRNRNYMYLKRKYGGFLNSISYSPNQHKSKNQNIWICWLQGEDNAPELVKKCISSVREFMPDYNIHIITSKNLGDYIQFPDYVTEKWENGIISNTLISDLIRTELLIRYGGLWLDATVFLTAPIPNYIFENELFMYTHSYPDDITMTFNNWLIYSTGDSHILKTVRDLLYEYWKKEMVTREYFMWHLFMTMVTEKYQEDVMRINYITDELPETLARIIFREFDPCFWDSLTKITPVHKLSNKFKVPENIEGTYYEKIMK